MKKYLIIITAVALAFGTCREALAQTAEPEAVDGYAHVRTEPVDDTFDLDQMLEERRVFDRMEQAPHDWSLSDAAVDTRVIVQVALIILCAIVIGILIGLIILHVGKLPYRIKFLEERIDEIEKRMDNINRPLFEEDTENPSSDEPQQDECTGHIEDEDEDEKLTGDEERDTRILTKWFKEIDEAFPYAIPDIDPDNFHISDHKGPDGQWGKVTVIFSLLEGNITSHTELISKIESKLKNDRLELSRRKAVTKIFNKSN